MKPRGMFLAFCFAVVVFIPSAQAQVGFRRTTFPTGQGPGRVIAGDFNGDGKVDLVTANRQGNSISLLLGNGDGTFQAKTDSATGIDPIAIVSADFNGDGRPDVVTANFSSNNISIFLNNGNGGFSARVDLAAGSGPRSLAAGDFNGDQKIDLAVANITGNLITILLGNGSGGFVTPGPPAVATAIGPIEVTLADVNGDGKLDLLVAYNTPQLDYFAGNGDGTFGLAVNLPGAATANRPLARDLSGDAKIDLVALSSNPAGANVLLGNGAGTFIPASLLGTDTEPISITSADFDNDGIPDLALGTAGYGYYFYFYYLPTMSVFRGTGGGAFGAREDFPLNWTAPLVDLVAADFDGNAIPDLAVIQQGTSSVSVLLRSPFIRSTPGFIDFGTQRAGTSSAAQTVTVTSTGSLAATLGSVTITGTDAAHFTKSNDTCTNASLTVGSSCTVQVAFAPATRGAKGAALSIPSNGGISPVTTSLAGIGAGGGVLTVSPTSISFGDQSVFSRSPVRTLTLSNTGNENLTVLTYNTNGGFPFGSFANNCGTMAPGQTCSFNMSFEPPSVGSFSGSLVLITDTINSPTTVSITGNGIPAPTPSFSATSLTFGNQQVTVASASQTITLNAVGAGTLTFAASTSGNFSQTNTCGSAITGGSSCTISVAFQPTAAGARSGNLVIATNAPGSPHSISLTGTGVDFTLVASGIAPSSIPAGQSATFQLTLTGSSGFSGNVALSCAVTRANGVAEPTMSCAANPSSLSLGSGTTATSTITVQSQSRGLLFRIPPVRFPPVVLWLWVAALILAWIRRSKLRYRKAALSFSTVVLLAGLAILSACGGGSSSPATQNRGTAAGSYSATVTATSGGATRTIVAIVTVQ